MNVAVFCGSSTGIDPVYANTAKSLGTLMASKSHSLIYGGGKVGFMGIIADAVLKGGGEVIGVIPQFLMDREVGHSGVTRLEVVQSMHQRKQRMADLAQAFIAYPGGWGTLEELAEILTWRQLGLISHPVVLLNVNDFFTPLLHQLHTMGQQGFVRNENLEVLRVAKTPEEALSLIIP
jgi:uncharacterized protein (TIGR00730 family)